MNKTVSTTKAVSTEVQKQETNAVYELQTSIQDTIQKFVNKNPKLQSAIILGVLCVVQHNIIMRLEDE